MGAARPDGLFEKLTSCVTNTAANEITEGVREICDVARETRPGQIAERGLRG